MMTIRRAVPVLLASFVLIAGACTAPPGGGGTPNIAPIAVASASPTSGNVPLTVEFDGTGSSDPDGTIAAYSWNFGNGTTGTGATAVATYPAAGTFNAVLTVTDNGGKSATSSVSVTVNGDGDEDGFFPPSDCDDSDASVHPGAADPAGDELDQNCDGIDGEQDAAVFVNSATGSNTSTCGTTVEPCASIGQGQTRAVADGKSKVFVAGGTYPKFDVVAGLEVRGGYGQNWQRGVEASGLSVATVTSSFDPAVGALVAIVASNVSTSTTVADMRVLGGSATAGRHSVGIHVSNSTAALLLDSLTVIGGTGGDGSAGSPGGGGWSGSAAGGSAGGGGFEPGGICNTSSAGAGGSGGSGSNNGGAGARGGVVDGSCGWTGFCSNCDAQPGLTGATGAGAGGGAGGAGGVAGTDGLPWICTFTGGSPVHGASGSPGAPGVSGANGAGGAPGAAGSVGSLGTAGAGGGGGGGGGANDCNQDDAGAGGGGGGAGGARAAQAGGGGGAGYRSVGLWLVDSSPTLSGIDITLGTGGKGGAGGAGAVGQPGGPGGPGGGAFEGGGAGGAGGAGGTGGASGTGGGGGGGAANGVVTQGSSTVSGTVQYSGGTGGAGGAGPNPGATGQVANLATI